MRTWIVFIIAVVLATGAAAWLPRSHGTPTPGRDSSAGHQHGPPEPASPPLAPQDALKSFRLAEPALHLDLVAAEPVIEAPVYLTFDEDGRLWVCEMRTYMPDNTGTGELETANRIVILEDADGDGTFEKSTVFLDGLVLPRGVAPCYQEDGKPAALVLEPPSLFFCRDTDGDGHADEKIKLLDGFAGRDNPEHAGNGLVYGLDNWWHLSQHNLEFRFDGEKVITRKTPNHGQWGITRDDLGRLYYTPNSNPLLTDVFPKHYAARNAHYPGVAGMGELIAPDATVWPAHATPGVNRGYQENVLRKDGTLASMTAACGPVIYRAGELGQDSTGRDFRGDAFICEAAGNLIKRMRIEEKTHEKDSGASGRLIPAARSAYDGQEFLASTDERFRPVHAAVGPDGRLYIADMYRGVIQHKTYMTAYLKDQVKQRGLEKPLNMGRIYRIGPGAAPASSVSSTSSASPASPAVHPRLAHASDDELVQLLKHPDGWWRDTAQRLLVERRATAMAPRLREMVANEKGEVERLHALWTLEGLGELAEADVLAALRDQSPTLRAAGLQLAESLPRSGLLFDRARAMVADTDPAVRLQVTLTLPELDATRAAPVLTDLLRAHGDDKYERSAAMTGLSGHEAETLAILLSDTNWPASTGHSAVLNDLCDAILRGGPGDRAGLAEVVSRLAEDGDARFRAVLERIRKVQSLDRDDPRPIALAREPARWTALVERGDEIASALSPSLMYFDWPGRPAVERRKRARDLNDSEQALFDRGSWLFKDCAACHQADGQGSPGLAPPLVGSSIALGPDTVFTQVLLHGLEGEYEMNSAKFQGAMPATQLGSDPDLAAVMTYVRRSWGHSAEPVKPETVAKVRAATAMRKKAWTRAEVQRTTPKEDSRD